MIAHVIELFRITALHNCLIEGYREDRARLYLEVYSNRMRGNDHKLEHLPSVGAEGSEQFIGYQFFLIFNTANDSKIKTGRSFHNKNTYLKAQNLEKFQSDDTKTR